MSAKNKKRVLKKKAVLTLVLVGIAAAGVTAAILWKPLSLKYRQHKAEAAFLDIFEHEEYNWCQMQGIDDYVPVDYMAYSIVYLEDGELPVLFLRLPMGYPCNAAGPTRMVIYDEESEQCVQIWGEGANSFGIRGFIRQDEDHEYPLVFADGGRQDVAYEGIFEFRDNELVRIATKFDIYPYDSDLVSEYHEGHYDEYLWRDEPVNITEYYTQRGMILNGYQKIDWNFINTQYWGWELEN